MLTDEQIATLTDAQRRDLVRRLARPLRDSGLTVRDLSRARRVRMTVIAVAVAAMVPWTAYLAWTLPHTYRANNWGLTWVGFDIGLLALMALTLVLGWRRQVLVVLSSFATGVMLVCDAWFDVMTAHTPDVDESLLSALLVELPLGILFMSGALRMMRIGAERLWLLEPGTPVWRLRLPARLLRAK